MSHIFEVAAGIRQILSLADPETGEMPVEFDDLLDDLNLSLDQQIDSLLNAAKQLESEAAVVEAEAEQYQAEAMRLKLLGAVRRNKARRCKKRIHDALILAQLKKHETAFNLVWLQKAPDGMDFVGDPDALPAHLKRVRVEPSLSAAMADYKANGEVPTGFQLRPGGLSLRSK